MHGHNHIKSFRYNQIGEKTLCVGIHTKRRNTPCEKKLEFLGASSKICEKAAVSFLISLRLSAWDNSVPTGSIFVKF